MVRVTSSERSPYSRWMRACVRMSALLTAGEREARGS